MSDFRKIFEEGCCTTPCNTVRTCMCALVEDMADEIERLEAEIDRLRNGKRP